MAVDHRLRGLMPLVKPRSGHLRFELLDLGLGAPDTGFEVRDAALPGLDFLPRLAHFCIGALLVLERLLRLLRLSAVGGLDRRSPTGLRAWCIGYRMSDIGHRALRAAPQELLVVPGIHDRVAVADVDHLRRELVDE